MSTAQEMAAVPEGGGPDRGRTASPDTALGAEAQPQLRGQVRLDDATRCDL